MDFLFAKNKPFNTTSIQQEDGGEETKLLLAIEEMDKNIWKGTQQWWTRGRLETKESRWKHTRVDQKQ